MDTKAFFDMHLSKHPVMGIFRSHGTAATLNLCEKAWDLGVQLVEVPIQTPSAVETLQMVVKAGANRGRLVGAGTVTSPEMVRVAAQVGAAFTVAPDVSEAVALEALRCGLPHLPGVATSTEIAMALSIGLFWQKIFPAEQLGPKWAAAQSGPFPQVQFVATGGINAENAQEFLDGGASAVAVGSAFADPEQIRKLAQLTAKGR